MNKLLLGNCLEYMKDMPDKSIDVVITDPPYGIGEDSFRVANRGKLAKSRNYGKFDWDKKLTKDFFDEMLRVSKNQVIFWGNYYADWLPASSCWLVWDKNNTADFADCELAWTSYKTAVRKFKYTWNGMLQENMKNKEYRVHPTQKPLPLMKWVVENYSKPGDMILDPFMGSGTTIVAAKELGRNYIGIDVSLQYFQAARMRLRQDTIFGNNQLHEVDELPQPIGKGGEA